MKFKINNKPETTKRFVVVKCIDEEFWYWGSYDAKASACQVAFEVALETGVNTYTIDMETEIIYG